MTASLQDGTLQHDAEYVPGRCNIGPAEIGRRRMVGHVGLAATILGFAILALLPISALWRLLLFFPASVSASGYLQAALHFCAGFGSRGIFNFGSLGEQQAVADSEAQRQDRRTSTHISLASGLIGVAAALVAVLVPI